MTQEIHLDAFDPNEFGRLMKALTEGPDNRFSPEKINGLNAAMRSAILTYLINNKRPIITLFVRVEDEPRLLEAGYSSGWANANYEYWVRPEQESVFFRPEPEVVRHGGYKERKAPRKITQKSAIPDNPILKEIASVIKTQRLKTPSPSDSNKIMSQSELGALAGLPKEHISRIESGQYGINAQTFYALVQALGGTINVNFQEKQIE